MYGIDSSLSIDFNSLVYPLKLVTWEPTYRAYSRGFSLHGIVVDLADKTRLIARKFALFQTISGFLKETLVDFLHIVR
jgi:hypothetical protein